MFWRLFSRTELDFHTLCGTALYIRLGALAALTIRNGKRYRKLAALTKKPPTGQVAACSVGLGILSAAVNGS